ncbi:MAG: helix-turn-helix transcriptional regulator [Chitinophagaceae bacterium]
MQYSDIETNFKQLAGLIGDPTRAAVMWALLDGKAYTATELAITTDSSASSMSMHLAKLLKGGLLRAESQGRHRYYSFAGQHIAYAIEAMANLLPATVRAPVSVSENIQVKNCRTCYDHLAGKLGVAITDRMLQQKIITAGPIEFTLTAKGTRWFDRLGINTILLQEQRRSFLRPCLDWSERRYHIAGSVAAALLNKMLDQDWIRKTPHSRVVTVTAKGQKKIYECLKLRV